MILKDVENKYKNSDTICIIVAVESGQHVVLAGANFNGGCCDCCRGHNVSEAKVVKIFDAVSMDVIYSAT